MVLTIFPVLYQIYEDLKFNITEDTTYVAHLHVRPLVFWDLYCKSCILKKASASKSDDKK